MSETFQSQLELGVTLGTRTCFGELIHRLNVPPVCCVCRLSSAVVCVGGWALAAERGTARPAYNYDTILELETFAKEEVKQRPGHKEHRPDFTNRFLHFSVRTTLHAVALISDSWIRP